MVEMKDCIVEEDLQITTLYGWRDTASQLRLRVF